MGKISADAELESHNYHTSTSAHREIQDNSQEQENKPIPRIEINTPFIG